MRSYAAARGMFSFLAGVSWVIIVGGLLMALIAASASGGQSAFGGRPSGAMVLLSTVPGLLAAFIGFLGLVGVQIGRATVDSAEYGQQALDVARKQLEVSRQALKQGAVLEQGYATLAAAKETQHAPSAPKTSYATERPDTKEAIPSQPGAPKVGETISYRGKAVRVVEDGFTFAGTVYETLDAAKTRIDQDAYALPPEPTIAASALTPETGQTDLIELQNGDIQYSGKLIRKGQSGYFYAGQTFPNVASAKAAVDQVVALQRPTLRAQR